MAISLTDTHHAQLDVFLEFVLDAYKNNEATRSEAVGALAHVLTAAAIDNEGEVYAWLNPDQYERWLEHK